MSTATQGRALTDAERATPHTWPRRTGDMPVVVAFSCMRIERLTLRTSDPAPLALAMQWRCHRRVRCVRLILPVKPFGFCSNIRVIGRGVLRARSEPGDD